MAVEADYPNWCGIEREKEWGFETSQFESRLACLFG
jgi:hypothetical protein